MNDNQINAVVSAMGGGFVIYLSLLLGQWLSGGDTGVVWFVFQRTIFALLFYMFLRYIAKRGG